MKEVWEGGELVELTECTIAPDESDDDHGGGFRLRVYIDGVSRAP